MRKRLTTGLSGVALVLAAGCSAAPRSPAAVPDSDAGVVHVAPPTGDRETDRASILGALDEVEPGGTVQFAPGTYLMGGQIIRITVPRITLAGHPEGTTLRGCHPDELPMQNPAELGNHCNGLELAGGWQTVRDLTFEHTFWALHVGCCWDGRPHMRAGEGGHLIEGNTFRSNSNAVRVHGYWSEPTIVRNNRFLNNWHSVAVYGNTVHLLDNDISAPETEEVQGFRFPADGIHIARPQSLNESAEGVARTCENNVVSGNRLDGVTEGIMVTADDPQIICRNNVIRDNTITILRARPPVMPGFIRIHDEADRTVVGVPLALRGAANDNLLEGNIIHGAEGLAIEIRGASRNRIVKNTGCVLSIPRIFSAATRSRRSGRNPLTLWWSARPTTPPCTPSTTTRSDVTIVVEGNRIAAIGADGSIDLPPETDVIDATGRTALPGLWDMHGGRT